MSMIQLKNVSKYYQRGEDEKPVAALRELNLEIEAQEYAAVTGPSGCGKSTLLHLLGGLDKPSEGSVLVDGVALEKAGENDLTRYRREKLGIVFQFFNLMPTMTVKENVTLPLLLQGERHQDASERADELLEMVGLAERSNHFAQQLSGGEMQRTAVARALAHRPALLLADEPTGNLDSASAERVLKLFDEIADKKLTTLLVVTHSQDVARRARREIAMKDGNLA